jgi:hypothetical protein
MTSIGRFIVLSIEIKRREALFCEISTNIRQSVTKKLLKKIDRDLPQEDKKFRELTSKCNVKNPMKTKN